ncbi:MAG: FIST N-terminal domain-containing protein [Candidatus Omnitrophota bacterium]|jgi:hypothetical protein
MPINVGVGLSTNKDPILAAQEALQHAKTNFFHEKIGLVFIFATINLSTPVILKTVLASIPEVPVIGCSGAAVIYDEKSYNNGLVIMLLGFSEGVYFNTAFVNNIKNKTPITAGEELGEKLLYGFKNIPRDLGLIFCDGLIDNTQDLVNGIQEKLGRSFPLVGACASDNLKYARTNIFHNNDLLSDSACGVLWGGKINFGLGIKHGWKPLGKQHLVTKSYGNIIYEIDSQPATYLYEDYLGCNVKKLQSELRFISVLYPIGIYVPGEEEYLLRNIRSIGSDGTLILQGSIPESSQVRLMIGTKESCLQATNQAIDDVNKGFSGKSASFVLIFDSISRYILLGRDAGKELEIIKKQFGPEIPVVGLYTYGEQAPLTAIGYRGKVYLHNQTVTLLAIGG